MDSADVCRLILTDLSRYEELIAGEGLFEPAVSVWRVYRNVALDSGIYPIEKLLFIELFLKIAHELNKNISFDKAASVKSKEIIAHKNIIGKMSFPFKTPSFGGAVFFGLRFIPLAPIQGDWEDSMEIQISDAKAFVLNHLALLPGGIENGSAIYDIYKAKSMTLKRCFVPMESIEAEILKAIPQFRTKTFGRMTQWLNITYSRFGIASENTQKYLAKFR